MTKIEVGPFYAMELVPAMVNTQGGPRRNINCEVLDLNDNPIPHLYSAGELGSFFSDNYQGGGNLLRKKGLRIESLAKIKSMSKENGIAFCK